MIIEILIGVIVAGSVFGAFAAGWHGGVAAERLRVAHVFDVAFSIVSSGALKKVYRRILGEYKSDMRLREELIRECEARKREKARVA